MQTVFNIKQWDLELILCPLFPFVAGVFFFGLFIYGKNKTNDSCFKFASLFFFALLLSKFFNFLVNFSPSRNLFLRKCFLSIQKRKQNCENCAAQTTRLNLAFHRKKCSARSLTRSSCANILTKFRAEINYQLSKKHLAAFARAVLMGIHSI